MGSFSIWHWLILLILFSPVTWGILGTLILVFQKKVLIKHAPSGLIKNGYVGWSWSYCLFGWLVPICRGEIGTGVLHLVLTFFTFGIFQAVMSFLYNKQFMTRMLTSGWVLADTEEKNNVARMRLKMTSV